MPNECTRSEYRRRKYESIALFDQLISDLAVGQVEAQDLRRLVENLLYIRSNGENGSARMPQDERKAPPEGSGSSETGGAQ